MEELKLLNKDGKEIYYAPSENSQFNNRVAKLLPFTFEIYSDSVSSLIFECLPSESTFVGLDLYQSFDETYSNDYCAIPCSDIVGELNEASYFNNECSVSFDIKQFDKEIGSVSFFINVADASSFNPIYFKGFNFSTPVPDMHRLSIENGQLHIGIRSWFIEESVDNIIYPSKWHHILIQWNTIEKTGYILIDEAKINIKWTYFSGLIEDHPYSVSLLGKSFVRDYANHSGSSYPKYGNFKIDELRVYDRWLTQLEIFELSSVTPFSIQ